MAEAIIATEHLSYCYGDGTAALKDLTVSFTKGKKIAVLGNNGAGKSTLFLQLNGVLRPSAGTVFYKGEAIQYTKKYLQQLRKSIGIVFQNPDEQLFAPTVYDDIAFGPRNLGLDKEEVAKAVAWAMEQTGTYEFKEKAPHFLSIGQKKRVAIAGILAMNPELIILDEPTAGLDAYYANKIAHILDEIHQAGKTLVLSTHDINFAFSWADELLIMNDGRAVASGSPELLFRDVELLTRCNLEKPLLMEIYEQMLHNGLISASCKVPRNKDELFSLFPHMQGLRAHMG